MNWKKNIQNIELSKKYKDQIDVLLEEKNQISDHIRALSDKLLDISKDLEKINDQGHKIKDELRDYQSLFEKSLENDKKIKDLEKLEKELLKAEADFKNIGGKLKLAEESKKSILINEFRKDLEKNGICPICGSIYDKKVEFLEVGDFDLEKIRQDFVDLKIKLKYLNEKKSDLKNSIDNKLKDPKVYEESLNEYKKSYQDLRNLYKKNLAVYDEKKKIRKILIKMQI
ncbi:hypothetical protein ANHYDRO_01447 [Anaerococcus hydrogenalis DSM 7454]|uniref:Zinc-hook domain-containing protein n=1 Tax=Anaerococcus hydrogenalis DSM 7454 TaxID=561177 RepID=B6WA21_9FIRM|nr:hypothetical protein [Anaerococcus hydrogenalis]EEB35781.1 hypothetical protein ANHYDRO_01447 [Anaerococcus hydrogenalis DSM 7454]